MREMELRYGSLVRALIARRRNKAKTQNGVKSGGPAGPGGWLTSFCGGLDVLSDHMAKNFEAVIRTNSAAASIVPVGGQWEITAQDGRRVSSRRVVLACPAFVSADIVRGFDSELSAALASIPYAPIAVVATGHRREDIAHPLDGFGFLIPRSEGLRTLGSIWTSSIFSARAPAGEVQFRTMLGGAGDPEAMRLSDGDLWQTVRRELTPLIGIRGDPTIRRIYRWDRGIPQFTLGHRERRSRIERAAARHSGLFMVGNAFHGVGLNDCVKMAHRVAGQITAA
jgi:oxygen-dependent protoporphyrinogen oxidase